MTYVGLVIGIVIGFCLGVTAVALVVLPKLEEKK